MMPDRGSGPIDEYCVYSKLYQWQISLFSGSVKVSSNLHISDGKLTPDIIVSHVWNIR